MEELELQEIDSFVPEIEKESFQYPHICLKGVSTEEEVLYFCNHFGDKNKSLPLYVSYENVYKCIGTIELTLDNLIMIRNIADYELTLVLSEQESRRIDLNNPATFLNFITL